MKNFNSRGADCPNPQRIHLMDGLKIIQRLRHWEPLRVETTRAPLLFLPLT